MLSDLTDSIPSFQREKPRFFKRPSLPEVTSSDSYAPETVTHRDYGKSDTSTSTRPAKRFKSSAAERFLNEHLDASAVEDGPKRENRVEVRNDKWLFLREVSLNSIKRGHN